MTWRRLTAAIAILGLALAASPAWITPADAQAPPVYKPPLRGAPGGRVGGASRGTFKVVRPLPTIDVLAPNGESGETASAQPTLYFYASLPVAYPTVFTISVPMQPAPVVERVIAAPSHAGIYAVSLADLGVRLEPGIVYTWSVSVEVKLHDPARDIVASASLLRVPADPQLERAARDVSAERRAALFAQAGLWYDAVAAAAGAATSDGGRSLAALLREVGLTAPAGATLMNAASAR